MQNSSTFPRSAAEYIFAKNAFDNHFIALMVGCLIIFVAIVSAAAVVAIGFSGYLATIFFPQLNLVFIAIALIAVLSFVNFYGISECVWINTAFTFIELA
jgi:amino acid transporter